MDIKENKLDCYAVFVVAGGIAVMIIRFFRGLPKESHIVLETLLYLLLIELSYMAVKDFREKRIPNRVLLFCLLLWAVIEGGFLIVRFDEALTLLIMSLAAAGFAGLTFLFCYFVTRGQLGAGDVKLAFVMGLYLTTIRVFPVVLYGTLLCLIFSVVQLIRKKIGMKDGLPLVPFLHLGLLITMVYL